MPDADTASTQAGAAAGEVAAQVAFVKRMLVLLVLAGLATSACLNVYLTYENGALKRQVTVQAERVRGLSSLYQFCQRFVTDLKHLSTTDETAQRLLRRYEQYINEFALDSPTRGAPGE